MLCHGRPSSRPAGRCGEQPADGGFAPERPAIERIGWRSVVGNTGSARIARSVRFRYEGLLRRAHVDSLGRSDLWIGGLLRDDDRAPAPWPVRG